MLFYSMVLIHLSYGFKSICYSLKAVIGNLQKKLNIISWKVYNNLLVCNLIE